MDVRLTIVDYHARTTQVAVLRLPIILGRDEHADIQLTDPWASHRHCSLSELDDGLVVTDLESKNGVFLHGHRITQSPLLPGDCIHIGQTEITVQYERSATAAVETLPNNLETRTSQTSKPAPPPPEPETRDLLYGTAPPVKHPDVSRKGT